MAQKERPPHTVQYLKQLHREMLELEEQAHRPLTPEELEEEMRGWERHREKLRRSAAGTLPSPGSPSLAEDRPKRRAAAMSIKAAGAKGEGQ